MAAAANGTTTANGGPDKSLDYEYDDDEFDMEAEMLRREFREASLLANGGGGGGENVPAAAVLEPTSQTQVDLSADRRPSALPYSSQQLQPAAVDHSSGGSSSIDSRVVGNMAYAYGNQSEYTVEHISKTGVGVGNGGVQNATAKSASTLPSVTSVNNNDDEYLVEQRLLGNGTDGERAAESPSPPLPLPPTSDICSQKDRVVTAT